MATMPAGGRRPMSIENWNQVTSVNGDAWDERRQWSN
jgi:hypothetical protein